MSQTAIGLSDFSSHGTRHSLRLRLHAVVARLRVRCTDPRRQGGAGFLRGSGARVLWRGPSVPIPDSLRYGVTIHEDPNLMF